MYINSCLLFSCSYIGSDKAIADLPFGPGNVASGGVGKLVDYIFWMDMVMVLTTHCSL